MHALLINPNVARWCNVIMCLLIYVKYLMIKPEMENEDMKWKRDLVGLKEE